MNDRVQKWILFIEGLFACMIQFYIFFWAPIQIARVYRLTQEVTPAGTIISLNMTISIYLGTVIA